MKFLPLFIAATFCVLLQNSVLAMAHDHTNVCSAQRCEQEKKKKTCGVCTEVNKDGKCRKYHQEAPYVKCNCVGSSADEAAAKEMIKNFYGDAKKIKVLHHPLPFCEGNSTGTVVMPDSSATSSSRNAKNASAAAASSSSPSITKKIIKAAVKCHNNKAASSNGAQNSQNVPEAAAAQVPVARSPCYDRYALKCTINPAPQFFAPNSDQAYRFASFMGYEKEDQGSAKCPPFNDHETLEPEQPPIPEGNSNVFM